MAIIKPYQVADCCPAVVVLSCDWNACKSYPIQKAIIEGVYTCTVNSPTPQTYTAQLLAGDRIKIPAAMLNEAATHTITIKDPNGDLLNDTCYQITTKIKYTTCLI